MAPYYRAHSYLITISILRSLCLPVPKKNSALELQRQLGLLYYGPIWYMLHKIGYAMVERDNKYELHHQIELDEGFFEVVPSKENSG